MKKNKLPTGLWPVMLTPFRDNNEIDWTCLGKLTDFYIEAGARGLFANCLSSEMFQLTDEERLEVIRTVIRSARGRVPVVASGTFSTNLKICSEFIKQVFDTGVKAVIVITNQLADMNEGDDVFKKRTEQLLALTGDIPLGMYECPDPYKRLLSPELMQWLGETGRFFYHKDTSCDLEAIKRKLKAIQNTPLALYNANTITALASLRHGAAGISPIGANLYPELYDSLIKGFEQNGDEKALEELNAQLNMMDAIVDQHYPFSAKLFLKKRGMPITTVCRIPSGRMHPENHFKLQALMDVFKKTAERFSVKINDIR